MAQVDYNRLEANMRTVYKITLDQNCKVTTRWGNVVHVDCP